MLGLVLFNIFESNMDSGIECSSHSAENSKLIDAVDTLDGRGAIQRGLDRLQRWAYANFVFNKFNKVVELVQF